MEPGHCRLRRVVSQRQQERRCLIEPGAHLLDLVDELSYRVSHFSASAGESVCTIWQVGQVALQAASISQIGLPCSAVSTGPIQANMFLPAEKVQPMALLSELT